MFLNLINLCCDPGGQVIFAYLNLHDVVLFMGEMKKKTINN